MISHEEAVMQAQERMVTDIVNYARVNAVDGFLHIDKTPFAILDRTTTTMGYVSRRFIMKHLWGNGLIIAAGDDVNLEINLPFDDELSFQLDTGGNPVYYNPSESKYMLSDLINGEFRKPVNLRARVVEMLTLFDAINIHYADGVDKILTGADELFA